MDRRKSSLIALNLIGGLAVLASYVVGVANVSGEALWGGVPESLTPLYTVNMFLAAGGYFFFTHYIVFRLDETQTRIGDRFGYSVFHLLYALVLIPSAAWLPLTAMMIDDPSTLLWATIRLVLFLVGAGSLGLVASLLKLGAHAPRGRTLAIAGLVPFCLQTVLLDALVWPAFFPTP
jgi:hypothetical protein